jgi:DNA topoisomerase IB
MAVAKTVSARLGNTPTIALQSYIDPTVFGAWKMAAA